MIDPFSISFDDRTGENLNIMIEEVKEVDESKIREEEEKRIKEEERKRAVTFSNEEWNKLGFFKRMGINKEEFIKAKSKEYFQKEEEERNIREEEEEEGV